MDRITLHEFERREVRLSPADQEIFVADTRKRISVTPTTSSGTVELNPNQYVGVVRMPSGVTLDLLPKVQLFNVMWMIAEVQKLEGINIERLQQDVEINTFDDLLEPIATAFVEQVEHLLDRGLYRAYIEQEDNLTTIRGRIDFREDLNRNAVLRHRTYCRFTEYSWDISENQVIRQVVRKLAGWGFSHRLTGRLIALDRQMEDISLTNMRAADVRQFTYSRQSDHYRPIHRYCHLFLDGFSMSEGFGNSPFDGFLMDMNSLFEQFVAIRLQAAVDGLNAGLQIRRQRAFPLFHQQSQKIRPDLLLENNGAPALVADTKYKRRDGADGSPADYYQLITYCTVLGLRNGVIIYPRHLIDIGESLSVSGSPITIHEQSVDLRNSREEIEREIFRIAGRLLHFGRSEISNPAIA